MSRGSWAKPAAVFLLGYRVWPGIFLGAFLANVTLHEPAATAGGIAVGNTLGALAGAYLLRRRVGLRNPLQRIEDVLRLAVLGAGVGAVVSATLGVTNLCLGGLQSWAAYGRVWWIWWLGDAVCSLVLAPVLLAWATPPLSRWTVRQFAEAGALLVGLVAVSLLVFGEHLGPTVGGHPLVYLVFPFMIWGALRFGQRGSTTVTLAVSSIAIWGTVHGFGPFHLGSTHQDLVLLQLFTVVVAISGLLLGAAITERKLAERRAAADHAITRTLGAAATLREAAPHILQDICERLGWDLGALWAVDREGAVLRCLEVWHRPAASCAAFAAARRRSTFASGVGLPGRIWVAAEPSWVADAAANHDVPYAAAAASSGLRGAFGFPILSGSQVLGVIELFSHEVQPPDEDALNMMIAIGSQIGQFIERHRGEEARRESEERLRQALDAGKMGVWDWNIPTGRIAGSNKLESMHGLAAGAFGGTFDAFQDLIYPRDRDRVLQEINRAREESADYEVEYRNVWPDGTVHWLVGKGQVVRDEAGRATRMIGVCMDNTVSKDLEEQLRQSQKMEAVGRLAGGVAHDFNNLLTVMLGESGCLLDQVTPAHPMYDSLIAINETVERAGALTHQLLAFSRKHVFSAVVVDLNEVLASTNRMLRRLVSSDIELLTVLQQQPSLVKMDRSQCEQVLVNLVVNARDAMPQGGKLTIETQDVQLDESYTRHRPGLQAGPYVMLAVSDTGCGMDGETLSHIFEPFFTAKPVGTGTGLGLATVYGIIQQSGGCVAAYSELERGTTFKVYLPRVERAADEAARPEIAPLAEKGRTETILLAEDEVRVRAIALRALQVHGYTVLEATQGDDALRRCELHDGPIHLLLTDVVMPGMTGLELAERATELRPDMKILFMSGYTDGALVHQGKLAADTAFLGKPFTGETLARKVREVLESS